jgi:protein O-GlcNAc transferase
MNRKQRRAEQKYGNPMTQGASPGVQMMFNEALRHHQVGSLKEAERFYRQILAADPHHADSLHLLGVVAYQVRRHDLAVELIGNAIAINSKEPVYHSNLGNAFRDQGKLEQAVACYRRALGLNPAYAEALCNLGNALKDQGKLAEAMSCYRRALVLKPGLAEIHNNLGNALKDQGKLDDAADCYRQALALKPNYAEAHNNLGNALRDKGQQDEAIAAFEQALAFRPDLAEAHCNLGNVLRDQGKLEAAVACCRQALVLKPGYAEAYSSLGNALRDQGKLDEALAYFRQALFLKPDDAEAHSNLLFCLNYDCGVSNEEIFKESVLWNKRHALCHRPQVATYKNDCSAGRRLRIGYVSPDLRAHSVAYFFEPLLQGHDRQAVEVFCYAEVMRPDTVTARLQGLSDHWRVTVGMSDDELAAHIRADGIDILIDLAGHTAHNRLGVFARKPAPVQATWLGYPNSTGLDVIDYRLVDAVTDPNGEADTCASETLLRLPGGFLCYGGPAGMPEPADPPCLTAGTVTFGSFNNPAKVSTATFDAWARLLSRLPEARLLLKGRSFSDAATCARFMTLLAERGVAPERVELVAWVPNNASHLALYRRIDIALDPFPYNGTTTTCEALWMGVPVVTLCGDRHAGRVGASLLSHSGLTDWIACTVEDYVAIAVALAGNPDRLRELRHSLRPRLSASPLRDGKAFAGQIEAALRIMWQRWLLNL